MRSGSAAEQVLEAAAPVLAASWARAVAGLHQGMAELTHVLDCGPEAARLRALSGRHDCLHPADQIVSWVLLDFWLQNGLLAIQKTANPVGAASRSSQRPAARPVQSDSAAHAKPPDSAAWPCLGQPAAASEASATATAAAIAAASASLRRHATARCAGGAADAAANAGRRTTCNHRQIVKSSQLQPERSLKVAGSTTLKGQANATEVSGRVKRNVRRQLIASGLWRQDPCG